MLDCCKPAWLVLVCLSPIVILQAQEALPVKESAYKDEIVQWRSSHEQQFRSPGGWLALTGHYWLSEGANKIGSSSDCIVRLPADAATGLAASVVVNGDKIVLNVSSGGPLLADGKEVDKLELPIDGSVLESDCPLKLTVGQRLNLQLVRRVGRYAVRVRDSHSELIRSFRGKQWFDVDPAYCVHATYHRLDKPKVLAITNIKGDEVEAQIAGTLHFEWMGQTLSLDAIEESPKSLFVMFRDRTSGKSTYGAGRFVDVELSANDSRRVVLDFNKAYNPPCAWSPHTLCPLTPKQNHLDIAIEAGEKKQP